MPQLALLTAGALLISIGLHAAYMLRQQREVSRLAIERQAGALVSTLAVASANPIVTGSLDALDDLLVRSADFPGILELRIADADGRILSHVTRADGRVRRVFDPPATRLAPPAMPGPMLAAERDRMVAWHPVKAGALLGWVRADVSNTALDEIGKRITMTTVVATLLAVVGSSLLLLLFLRRPMRALEDARRFAVDLHQSEGRLLPALVAPAEIEDVTAALNYASAKLHEQRQQLARTMEWLQAEERITRERTEQVDTIFALSPDGLVSFDGKGRVKLVNPAFLRMTGLRATEIVGRPPAELERLLRELAENPEQWPGLGVCFAGQEAKVGAGETAAGEGPSHPLMLRRPRGAVLDLVGVNSTAAAVSRLLYVRDVTREMEVDRLKSEFLAHAAHELRTPMASIYGFTELLMSQEFDDATRRDLLATIHRQTEWLIEIINELLDLARIEARRGKDFRIEAVPLAPLVGDTVAAMNIDPARWPLVAHIPDGLPAARADAAKLRQVLTNVLSNAVKYSPAGGAIDLRCGTREIEGKTFVEIAVADHGIGMTPEQAARVGERFYRADSSGNIPGAGLGVTIVKEIVELHGGGFSLRSTLGAGTTVTLWLPADVQPHAPEGAVPGNGNNL
ncbi:sensor histidine kinase [Sulfuritalea hydrogenivorans]|nr:ATP-binding protein [Sulfuritalea hydrogenivorans]